MHSKNLGNGVFLATAGTISGHATHIGVVDQMNSRWVLKGKER